MTVREFIERNANCQVQWFDKRDGARLYDVQMQNESKRHFRDRNIYMIYRSMDDSYDLDIYVYPNVEKDIWLKGDKR